MYVLVVIACGLAMSGEPNCSLARKVDVAIEPYPSMMGCAVVGNLVRPSYEAANPGYRVTETKCVPIQHLERVLTELRGEEA
jgi:hypothetical protein